ncbi:hypothetical protein ACFL14_01540 [Patescibacteria group bacterium]
MRKFITTNLVVGIIALFIAVWLWSTEVADIGWGMTTNWCATAFTYWTILVFLGLFKLKIPQIAYFAGALFFVFLGTYTLVTYRPFFDIPTIVHLMEAFIGYGHLIELWLKPKK